MGKKTNCIVTRNTYPSIRFNKFHELSSKVIQKIDKNFEAQDSAERYFVAIMQRLRAEIYTQNGCDIFRHVAMTIKKGTKCVRCSRILPKLCPWSWTGDIVDS